MKFLKLPIFAQLLIILAFSVLFGDLLPRKLQEMLYSISLTLKDLLLFMLPAVIFCCILSSILSIKGKSTVRFISVVIIIVCISNYIATLLAYWVGSLNLINIKISSIEINYNNSLFPMGYINFPELLPNNYFLLLGFSIGIIMSFFHSSFTKRVNSITQWLVSFFLEKCFLPLLPVFILGFVLKLQVENILIQNFKFLLPLFVLIILTYVIYVIILFLMVAKFNFYLCYQYIKNTIPAVITGFATMSSLVAMPLTLDAAEKNTGSSSLSHLVIPTTVNIHTIGLAINIPLIALSMLLSFGYELPSFDIYLEFAFYFILAQFGIAAAPGCGILLMVPLLESYLGFTNDMSALIVTIYILFDPAETSTNILGNSALVIFLSKLKKFYRIQGKYQ